MLVILLIAALAQAHVPSVQDGDHSTRDTAFHVGDIVGKSWGIYTKSSSTQWFMFVGHAGDDLSLSISTITDDSRNGLLNATLHGMHAADIVCEDGWTGWEAPDRRLDATGGDHDHDPKNETEETFNFPYPEFKEKKFEPFGVGVYVPVTACDTTFPSTGAFFLEVTPLQTDHETYYTVGAGMVEAFSAGEIVGISYMLYPTYEWFLGAGTAAVLVVLPFLFIVFGLAAFIWFHEIPNGLELNAWRGLVLAAMVLSIPSPAIFIILLIDCAVQGVDFGGGIWATLIIHIFVPLIVIGLVLWFVVRIREDEIPKLTLGKFFGLFAATFYLFMGVWQSYLIGTSVLVMGFIAYTVAFACEGGFKYQLVPV